MCKQEKNMNKLKKKGTPTHTCGTQSTGNVYFMNEAQLQFTTSACFFLIQCYKHETCVLIIISLYHYFSLLVGA